MAPETDIRTDSADEAAIEVATVTTSTEVKDAAAQAVSSKGNVEVTGVLLDQKLALVRGLLALVGIKDTSPEVEENALDVEISDAGEKRELTPEAAKRTLSTLEARFHANARLHENCDWSKVKSALKANPEALWSVNQMEAQGHMSNVYNFDDDGFDIGTCSKETPESARNCIYDAQAAAWLKRNYPNETFNGSAVEMADAMGIKLMSPEQYIEVLQTKGHFDRQTRSFLLTHKGTRKSGYAFFSGRSGRHYSDVNLNQEYAYIRRDTKGWRGSLRVTWA